MICEGIFSKIVCGIFLIFCSSHFINNFAVMNNFGTPKSPKLKYLDTNLKFPHTVLKIFSAQINRNYFFFFNFSRTCNFFHECKTTNLGTFSHKKLILQVFWVWLFNFDTILKTCLKNLFRKTEEKRWFYSNKSIEPNKLLKVQHNFQYN